MFTKPPTKATVCVRVCVLMKPAGVAHHDIRYAVEEGSDSQAQNHLLCSEKENKT